MDLSSWKALPIDQKLQAARSLTPPRFEWVGVERCTLGETSNEVALFSCEGRRLALMPGGTVTLGYDRAHPYLPSAEQAEDLAQTQESLGFTLETFLDHHMSPLRTVTLAPFLIDVEASKQDAFDEEAIANLLEGFRLPTTDEWEYACSGGAPGLFRWGNHCPSDEISENAKSFDLHKRKNAFGLTMNQSTYTLESCQDDQYRGGDGGSAVCGAYGLVVTWMPFASSFTPGDELDPAGIDEVWVRRVLPL